MLFSLILKDQLDEETGIRGYAGTRQKLFLEPYQTASARMNADFDQVGRRLQKLGVNSALYILADATATNDRWKHVIAAPIIAMQPYNPLIQRTGKVLIDRFRRDVIRLDDIIRTRQFKLDTIERLAITRVSVLNFVLVFLIIVLAVSAGGMRFLKMYRREQSIAIAYQEASLPRKLPEVLGIVFHSFYSPGKNEARVGGDWYDAIRLLDGRIIISIGDVAGSGLKAAVIMANMRQVIRGSGYVNPDPVLMLNAADKMLRAEYPDTTVTAFVGILDAIERTLLYASAGHPPPFLRLPDGTLKMLSSQGLILGLRGRDEPFPEQVVIEDGSRLILYTDGLTEFTRDYQEGEQRLRAALENTDLYTSPNIAEELYNVILSDGAQDDVAILAIEWEPLPIATEGPLSRWTFDVHDADATMHTREAFTQQLKMESISPDDIAMAELVFMELIGNVLRYAPGRVEIAVDWSGACPVLHAIDHGPGFSHNPKLPDLFAESGRGIYLVSMLTETFEVLKVPGGGSHACAVLLLGNPNVRERKHRLKHIDSGTCSAFSYPDDARRFRQAKEPIQI
jgi:CHASE3 domain sensor protein/anti-sigma regulatory factor (Ser/Thr protein kinase)